MARAAIERHLKRFSRFGGKNPAVFNGACSNCFSRSAKKKREFPLWGHKALEKRTNRRAFAAHKAHDFRTHPGREHHAQKAKSSRVFGA